MKTARLSPAWGLVVLTLSACGGAAPSSPTPTATPTPVPSPKVAIISIDGLRPDALGLAGAPAIQGLAGRGAYTWRAQTILPSNTLPSHASMVSGYEPSVHGVTWDDYRPERGTIAVPTMFLIAREAGLRTVMVVGKDKLAHLNAPGAVDRYVCAARGDAEVASQAVTEVMAGFDLLFVHFPQTDLTGHSKGWMSAAYLQQVADTDQAVGQLLSVLPPQTTVILTADHGGNGVNHGTSAPPEVTIPWIIAGGKVRASGPLGGMVRTTDTAATALYALGLSLRSNATGKPVAEAFGVAGTSQSVSAQPLLPAGSLAPEPSAPASFEQPAPRPDRSRDRAQQRPQ